MDLPDYSHILSPLQFEVPNERLRYYCLAKLQNTDKSVPIVNTKNSSESDEPPMIQTNIPSALANTTTSTTATTSNPVSASDATTPDFKSDNVPTAPVVDKKRKRDNDNIVNDSTTRIKDFLETLDSDEASKYQLPGKFYDVHGGFRYGIIA